MTTQPPWVDDLNATKPESFGQSLQGQSKLLALIEQRLRVLDAHGVEVVLHREGKGWLRLQGMSQHVQFNLASVDLEQLQQIRALFERECRAAGVDIGKAPPAAAAAENEVQP